MKFLKCEKYYYTRTEGTLIHQMVYHRVLWRSPFFHTHWFVKMWFVWGSYFFWQCKGTAQVLMKCLMNEWLSDWMTVTEPWPSRMSPVVTHRAPSITIQHQSRIIQNSLDNLHFFRIPVQFWSAHIEILHRWRPTGALCSFMFSFTFIP